MLYKYRAKTHALGPRNIVMTLSLVPCPAARLPVVSVGDQDARVPPAAKILAAHRPSSTAAMHAANPLV